MGNKGSKTSTNVADLIKQAQDQKIDKEESQKDFQKKQKNHLKFSPKYNGMQIKNMLTAGQSPLTIDQMTNQTLLHQICDSGQDQQIVYDIASELLQKGVNPLLKDKFGNTAIHYSSKHCYIDTTKMIALQGGGLESICYVNNQGQYPALMIEKSPITDPFLRSSMNNCLFQLNMILFDSDSD